MPSLLCARCIRGMGWIGRLERFGEKPRGGLKMSRYLKRGLDVTAIKEADANVRQTVENILADIEARGDQAVRDLSKKFDNWEPDDFRLSPQQIDAAIAELPRRDIEDIKFAQAQV